jgi:hypothetical protein
MRTLREKAAELVRRWRVGHYQRKAHSRRVKEQREADHVERLQAGIKDINPGA